MKKSLFATATVVIVVAVGLGLMFRSQDTRITAIEAVPAVAKGLAKAAKVAKAKAQKPTATKPVAVKKKSAKAKKFAKATGLAGSVLRLARQTLANDAALLTRAARVERKTASMPDPLDEPLARAASALATPSPATAPAVPTTKPQDIVINLNW